MPELQVTNYSRYVALKLWFDYLTIILVLTFFMINKLFTQLAYLANQEHSKHHFMILWFLNIKAVSNN